MKYRLLGSTQLRVSVIGIGTWQFGGEWGKDFTQDEVTAMFKRGRELGMNFIDTAECYGDHLSEKLIGAAIEGQRDKWVVATKFGHKFTGHMQRAEPRSPGDIEKQLHDSLKALRTDYVDLYQYHSYPDDQFVDDDVYNVLRTAQDAGKIKYIGNSISKNDNLKQMEATAKRGLETLQVIYNRLDRKPEHDLFAVAMEADIGVLARVPLASGYLSGKYKPGAAFPPGDVRASHDPADRDRKLAEVEKIAREEVPHGVNMATWALAWCLQHPAVSCVIPGCKDVKQIESNASAADLDLVSTEHRMSVE